MSKKRAIVNEYDEKNKLYQRFTTDIESLLKRIIQAEGIVCNAITSRLKSRESLCKKIDLKTGKYNCLADLTDIAGIRIITYYDGDVDRIAEIVEREFSVDRENSIDKRMALEPDRFGYCSLHYVVSISDERVKLKEYEVYANLKCEIQIRSVLQHAWAEIEHDLGYKSERAVPRDVRRNFSRLAGLLEIADKEFMEIRDKLSDYQIEVQEKIEHSELYDKELDSILLDTLCCSNQDLKEVNEQIAVAFNSKIDNQSTDTKYLDFIIKLLSWFNITTVGQLLEAIQRNKINSVEIAKEIASQSSNEFDVLPKGIGCFYICYSELLDRYDNYSKIVEYLEFGSIEGDEGYDEVADELLNIRKKLYH